MNPLSRPTFRLRRPRHWLGGVIVASPHSGRDYPDWFLEGARLHRHDLRASEDAFVDRLIAPARAAGAVVLSARVPRCVVDLNRARDDLDPKAVEGLSGPPSPRSRAGLGVIPRVVARDRLIFDRPIARAEAEARLATLWQPYHDVLDGLIAEAMARFGQAVLIDVHSMPRAAVAHLPDPPDMVIGDRYGAAAGAWLRDALAHDLAAEGYRLTMNTPFAGAHILIRHGRPLKGRHALQLEIDRSLYMDEARIMPHDGFEVLAGRLARIWASVAELCARRVVTDQRDRTRGFG